MPRKPSSTKRTFTSALESGQRASAPLKRVLSGTSVAPAPMAPSTVTIQDSPLGAQIAIRSPGATPAPMNAPAARGRAPAAARR